MDLEGLKRRQGGIGGSDAAAVLGVPTARRTPLAVYESKVVPIEALEPEETFGPSYWGTKLEQAIAETFLQRLSGVKLMVAPGTLRRPGTPLVATPDRFLSRGIKIDHNEPDWGLEVKTADRSKSAEWGPTGGSKIPEEYWVQVQHYYMVMPTIVRFDVAVLIGGNDYREYDIPRDDEFCKDLLSAELAWWERHVVPKVPPQASSRDIGTLKKLYPGTDGSETDISALVHWHLTRQDAAGQIDRLKIVKETAEVMILEAMKGAAVGNLTSGFGRYQRKLIKRAGYTVDPTEYMELRHIKPKGGQ